MDLDSAHSFQALGKTPDTKVNMYSPSPSKLRSRGGGEIVPPRGPYKAGAYTLLEICINFFKKSIKYYRRPGVTSV